MRTIQNLMLRSLAPIDVLYLADRWHSGGRRKVILHACRPGWRHGLQAISLVGLINAKKGLQFFNKVNTFLFSV